MKISTAWSTPEDSLLKDLKVSRNIGLSQREVKNRLKSYGPNRLAESKKKSLWSILAAQFKNVIMALLAVAAVVSFAFGDWVEGLAVLGVMVINAAIGFVTEVKAVKSMASLRKMSRMTTRVRRDGTVREVPSENLVPGDIIIMEGGDIIGADLRVLTASRLQVDESALTGESLPVTKSTGLLPGDTGPADRTNMLYQGTFLTRGSGEGVVVATGMATELGKIAAMVESAKEGATPLEKQLDRLGKKLIRVTAVVAVVVATGGIISGKGFYLMIETAIALAVATIPEGLPIVATIALARGMLRMARKNALINKLSAVETLGSTTLICTDKTGTLTENKMTVVRLAISGDDIHLPSPDSDASEQLLKNPIIKQLLTVTTLCNNASLPSEGEPSGDPLEISLLAAARQAGLTPEQIQSNLPEEREEAFDSEVKMMATFNRDGDRYLEAVKGAPEKVLNACSYYQTRAGTEKMSDEDRDNWLEKNRKMAEEGLRVLAAATRRVDDLNSPPYQGLIFLGLIGLLDPPRTDIRPAIAACRGAGIRVVMVTGDQPVTAGLIGYEVGLTENKETRVIHGRELKPPDQLSDRERDELLRSPIFARVSPEQKLDLIGLHQQNGSIVAMTGDGVNDAPALKKADIGIAMGERGTQVAREAADMVLLDDAFSTIVSAISQGRAIFDNIRSFVLYLLSCNISEVLVIGLASLVNAPLPILPIQILFLNLITDIFPALALGVGEGDPAIMDRRPRKPEEPIISNRLWRTIGGYGLLMTIAVLGSFWLALNWLKTGDEQAITISFLTLAFTQLWHVFNLRGPGGSLFRNNITRNPYIWGALILCTVITIGAVYLPGPARILKLTDPGFVGWMVVMGMSIFPLLVGQVWRIIAGRRRDERKS